MKIKFKQMLLPNIPYGYETDILEKSEHGYHFECPDGVVAILTEKGMEGIADIIGEEKDNEKKIDN